jgi:phosphohistidine phosphatase
LKFELWISQPRFAMLLYLLRHADADTEAQSDAERALSKKGEEQAARVGRFCERNDIKPAVILASPLRRAQQTAKVVAEKLGVELVTVRWLACGAEPAAVLGELAGRRKFASVMLVGHEPDLSCLVSHLLGGADHNVILIRKASLTALELLAFRLGGGQLQFSIPVKLM